MVTNALLKMNDEEVVLQLLGAGVVDSVVEVRAGEDFAWIGIEVMNVASNCGALKETDPPAPEPPVGAGRSNGGTNDSSSRLARLFGQRWMW